MTAARPLSEEISAVAAAMRANLAAFSRIAPPTSEVRRRAGVALTVFEHRGEPCVLVIKRAFGGRNAGQWALPGGRAEEGETAVEAALRELDEEAGLQASDAEVAGVLDDFVTGSGFVITPVVVVLDRPARPRRDPVEVHSLHPVPLHRLLDDALPRWRTAADGSPLLQMPLRHDMVIHAPTGAILWQFQQVALLGQHTRVSNVAQPEWTHQ